MKVIIDIVNLRFDTREQAKKFTMNVCEQIIYEDDKRIVGLHRFKGDYNELRWIIFWEKETVVVSVITVDITNNLVKTINGKKALVIPLS